MLSDLLRKTINEQGSVTAPQPSFSPIKNTRQQQQQPRRPPAPHHTKSNYSVQQTSHRSSATKISQSPSMAMHQTSQKMSSARKNSASGGTSTLSNRLSPCPSSSMNRVSSQKGLNKQSQQPVQSRLKYNRDARSQSNLGNNQSSNLPVHPLSTKNTSSSRTLLNNHQKGGSQKNMFNDGTSNGNHNQSISSIMMQTTQEDLVMDPSSMINHHQHQQSLDNFNVRLNQPQSHRLNQNQYQDHHRSIDLESTRTMNQQQIQQQNANQASRIKIAQLTQGGSETNRQAFQQIVDHKQATAYTTNGTDEELDEEDEMMSNLWEACQDKQQARKFKHGPKVQSASTKSRHYKQSTQSSSKSNQNLNKKQSNVFQQTPQANHNAQQVLNPQVVINVQQKQITPLQHKKQVREQKLKSAEMLASKLISKLRSYYSDIEYFSAFQEEVQMMCRYDSNYDINRAFEEFKQNKLTGLYKHGATRKSKEFSKTDFQINRRNKSQGKYQQNAGQTSYDYGLQQVNQSQVITSGSMAANLSNTGYGYSGPQDPVSMMHYEESIRQKLMGLQHDFNTMMSQKAVMQTNQIIDPRQSQQFMMQQLQQQQQNLQPQQPQKAQDQQQQQASRQSSQSRQTTKQELKEQSSMRKSSKSASQHASTRSNPEKVHLTKKQRLACVALALKVETKLREALNSWKIAMTKMSPEKQEYLRTLILERLNLQRKRAFQIWRKKAKQTTQVHSMKKQLSTKLIVNRLVNLQKNRLQHQFRKWQKRAQTNNMKTMLQLQKVLVSKIARQNYDKKSKLQFAFYKLKENRNSQNRFALYDVEDPSFVASFSQQSHESSQLYLRQLKMLN